MFKREPNRQVAIRIERIYYKHQMAPIFKIKGEAEAKRIVKHIKEDPDIYRRMRKESDSLEELPKLNVRTGNLGKVPAEPHIPVIAELKYTCNPKKVSKVSMGWIFLIMTFFVAGASLLYGSVMMNNLEQDNYIRNLCKIYTDNGEPEYIIIQNTKYNLNSDWTPKEENQLGGTFVNPWHRRQLRNLKECMVIERK